MYFVMGYTGYFLLGHVLYNAEISSLSALAVYAAGLAGLVVSAVIPNDRITVNILCESAAVFVFFKRNFSFEVKAVRLLSQYSFGAYLVHVAVLNIIVRYSGLLSVSPVLAFPLIALIVFAVSMVISAILNHIPVLKKYIV